MEVDTRKYLQYLLNLPNLPKSLHVPSASFMAAFLCLSAQLGDQAIPEEVAVGEESPSIHDFVDKEEWEKLRGAPEIHSRDLARVFGKVPSGVLL